MKGARSYRSGVRSRLQRAFFDWYRSNRHRFVIPLRVERRIASLIVGNFVGLTPLLSVTVSRSELNVAVIWDRECFDLLLSLDVAPLREPTGYVCTMCEPAHRRVFASRQALWNEHLFEPFLQWVNSHLASARWLQLLSIGEGSRSASLLVRDDERKQVEQGRQLFVGSKDISEGHPYGFRRDQPNIVTVPLRLAEGGPGPRELRRMSGLATIFNCNEDRSDRSSRL